MKLVIRNISNDPDVPVLRPFTEAGDEIENVQFLAMSQGGELGSDVMLAEIRWYIFQDGKSASPGFVYVVRDDRRRPNRVRTEASP